jgi:hypothetical protein
MKTLKQFALVAAAIAVAASPALAGTKYAANLVSNSPTHPPTNPTLSSKSSIKLSDTGSIQVGLAGVTDGGGTLVTSTSTYGDTGTLDGTEHTVIIKIVIPGIAGFIERVEVPVPVVLNKGKGKTKLSAASLFALIPGGVGRTLEIIGSEVWGPLGANAAACQAVLDSPIPASLIPTMSPPDPSCRGGSQIGMSGLDIPLP